MRRFWQVKDIQSRLYSFPNTTSVAVIGLSFSQSQQRGFSPVSALVAGCVHQVMSRHWEPLQHGIWSGGEGETVGDINNLPADLREHGLFCVWRYEKNPKGDLTKVPVNPNNPRFRADSTDKADFAPLETALKHSSDFDGVGVGVFDGLMERGKLCGVDIDHCIDDHGGLSAEAGKIMDVLKWMYWEKSPSGHGLRGFGLVSKDFKYDTERFYIKHGPLELYVGGATNRFLTVTGDVIRPAERLEDVTHELLEVAQTYMRRPAEQTDTHNQPGAAMLPDDDVLKMAANASNGEKFRKLWSGDTSDYPSESEADLALCGVLAFWCRRDPTQIDKLFRQSALFRKKWDSKRGGSTYGEWTVRKAIRMCSEVWEPERKVTTENGVIKAVEPKQRIIAVTAAELDAMDIPPVEWLVEGLLPIGSACLSAPPKSCKSYMAIDLCISICTGEKFLGRKTNKAACLYFDLESGKRRPKQRIRQVLGDRKAPDNFFIVTGESEPGMVGAGFEDTLMDQLQQHPEIRLVVIDVLQKVRPPRKSGTSMYDSDYDLFAPINKIAIRQNVAVLCITHNRKLRDPSDPFNDITGSTGILGSVDAAFVISKSRRFGDDDVTLFVTGREMPEQELAIKFNQKSFRWECMGTAEQRETQRAVDAYHSSRVVSIIKELIQKNGGTWEGSAQDMVNYADLVGKSIPMNTKEVGREVNKFFSFFDVIDGIQCASSRTGKYGRIYKFHDTHNTVITSYHS